MADALLALYAQLDDLIDSMEDEGIIDNRIINSFRLRDPMHNGSRVFTRLLPFLCNSSESAFMHMGHVLECPSWNYVELAETYVQIKRTATCIGASSVEHTLGILRYAILAGVRNECFSLLNRMKQEYLYLRQQLETLVELARRIRFIELALACFLDDDSDSCISSDSDSDSD